MRNRIITYVRTADGWEWSQPWKVELSRKQKAMLRMRASSTEESRAAKRKYRRKLKGCVDPSGETKHGPCEICERECSLHYDHDHSTGLFRGWLCNQCNYGLGNFRDSLELLSKAAAYLGRKPAPQG